jgi:hypothetical protein
MEGREKRRKERREFFRVAATAAVAAPLALTIGGKPLSAQTQPTDADVLNFALNLEYLEAQFYVYAVTGAGLPESSLSGTGTRGQVDATGARQVAFRDQQVAQYAREIAADERAHVDFLRNALAGARVAQPTIDISTRPNGAFSNAARAAGLVGAGQAFDPYANDENFLLGAFIFEDVGVTAYKGAASLINNKTFLEASAGILAVEAYHAGLIRTALYRKGIETPSARLIEATEAISTARDSLDNPQDVDQGVAPMGNQSNIAPVDQDGIAFGRTAGDVLNIVYLTAAAASQGGFFPNGVNGNIRTSTAG